MLITIPTMETNTKLMEMMETTLMGDSALLRVAILSHGLLCSCAGLWLLHEVPYTFLIPSTFSLTKNLDI